MMELRTHYLYVIREEETFIAKYTMTESNIPDEALMCIPVPNYAMTIKLKDYLNRFQWFAEDCLRFVKWNNPGDWKKLNECSWMLNRAGLGGNAARPSVGVSVPAPN